MDFSSFLHFLDKNVKTFDTYLLINNCYKVINSQKQFDFLAHHVDVDWLYWWKFWRFWREEEDTEEEETEEDDDQEKEAEAEKDKNNSSKYSQDRKVDDEGREQRHGEDYDQQQEQIEEEKEEEENNKEYTWTFCWTKRFKRQLVIEQTAVHRIVYSVRNIEIHPVSVHL